MAKNENLKFRVFGLGWTLVHVVLVLSKDVVTPSMKENNVTIISLQYQEENEICILSKSLHFIHE